ncbi:hypothetical protein Mapa_007098 [Marchantia paleacea]|nr:hypothetical protein Mapa_007098 [Marchantia paleacea]
MNLSIPVLLLHESLHVLVLEQQSLRILNRGRVAGIDNLRQKLTRRPKPFILHISQHGLTPKQGLDDLDPPATDSEMERGLSVAVVLPVDQTPEFRVPEQVFDRLHMLSVRQVVQRGETLGVTVLLEPVSMLSRFFFHYFALLQNLSQIQQEIRHRLHAVGVLLLQKLLEKIVLEEGQGGAVAAQAVSPLASDIDLAALLLVSLFRQRGGNMLPAFIPENFSGGLSLRIACEQVGSSSGLEDMPEHAQKTVP